MAPGRARGQQPPRRQQQQQLSKVAATSREQSLALLQRLSEAPDLSLFKEKVERVKQYGEVYNGAADAAVVLLARAAAHGLHLLHPLLLVDLPKQALECINELFCNIISCCIIIFPSSPCLQSPHHHQQQQQQQQEEELAARLQATGK
jgi:hypothetical protein